MEFEYAIAVTYEKYRGVFSTYDSLGKARTELIANVVYYVSIGKKIDSATITKQCKECSGTGSKRIKRKRRYKGSYHKFVTCPICKNKLERETDYYIDPDNQIPEWLYMNLKN